MKRIKEKGITLVALVLTIIILLILSGVTLGTILGDNGIIRKTQKAVDIYQVENEREAIGISITTYKLGGYTENKYEKLGKPLADRNLENSSIWDIIVKKADNKEYGTGWNYIEKGTNIEGYGEAKNNWVVNYETGEIIKLEDKTYNNFNYKSTIAADNPLFNLDSANVNFNKSSWGNNATLYYYDDKTYDTIEKRKEAVKLEKGKDVITFNGYDRQKSNNIEDYLDNSTGAFKFNGNNYIEIYNENGYDFTNGLTFEFYGNISNSINTTYPSETFIGVFSLWDGFYDNQSLTRFGIYPTFAYYSLCTITQLSEYGGLSNKTYPWNQRADTGNIINQDVFLTIVFKPQDENIIQKIYINGIEKVNSWISKVYYNAFNDTIKNLHYLEFGRCTFGVPENWSYLKGICYSLRMYNRALTEKEIQANYDITTDFHKYIIDSKK